MKMKASQKVLSILLSFICIVVLSNPAQACVCTPPTIRILSPENKAYTENSIPLIFTISEACSWIGYSLNGQTNATVLANTTLTSLLDGAYWVVVYANDTCGNMGVSNKVDFAVDATSPAIVILSPENKTYSTDAIPLTFTIDEAISWMGYSLDGEANATISGNATLSDLFDGMHYVVVYANDTNGNMGMSNTVYFAVDTTPPNITDVSQIPLPDNVLTADEVRVNATITDNLSGVRKAILNYTNGDGTWIGVNMTNLEGNVWNGTIPAFDYCNWVNYTIMAEDEVGNIITTAEIYGYQYQYHVIPEFPSLLILSLFMIATLLATIICRRKHLAVSKQPIEQ